MMRALRARGERLAEARAEHSAARIEAAIADGFPDLLVVREGKWVTLAGRGLRARMLRDAGLRWIGGLLR